jgi:hypothetical protein
MVCISVGGKQKIENMQNWETRLCVGNLALLFSQRRCYLRASIGNIMSAKGQVVLKISSVYFASKLLLWFSPKMPEKSTLGY